MKKQMIDWMASGVFGWALLMGCVVQAVPGRVTILHTNDTHAHIDDGHVAFSAIAVEKARAKASGDNVLLVDAGDYVQGTALGGFDEGRTVIDIMNAAGYDVATLGNHEFDYGIPALFRNVERSKFKVTSCNLLKRETREAPGRLVLPPYVVTTAGTVRVAFVGVTTPSALVSAKPSTFLDPTGTFRQYDFIAGEKGKDLYAALQKNVNDAAKEADYVGGAGASRRLAGMRGLHVDGRHRAHDELRGVHRRPFAFRVHGVAREERGWSGCGAHAERQLSGRAGIRDA